jgi:phosphoribosyl 1,2-cyclic phosphate phosphodiesterase
LRKRSALLIDDDFLIDLGPDIMAAALMHGLSLARLRYCIQTHEHDDHLDPAHFGSRSPLCGVPDAPRLAYYATRGAIAEASTVLGTRATDDGLLDPAVADRLNLEAHVIAPFETFAVGPYRVAAVPAVHDPRLVCVLYAIERDGRSLFYGIDTGPLPATTWSWLRLEGWRFDVAVLDHTFGTAGRSTGHLNGEQFLEEVAAMRDEGLLADDARIFAHHLAHHSNPVHPELVDFAAARGYGVVHDGLMVDV